jgi:predicted GTPase
MTQRKFSASLSRSQGREGWSVIFSHPMPARGKPGLRVRRGLSTKKEDEARELVGQLNDILGDQQFWQTSARSRAEARFDQRVVTIFYSYLVPETVDSFQVRNSVIRLPERDGSHISALLLGTTGSGKTTLVRQLLGTDPHTERFPSTSPGKTTIADTELIADDGLYRGAVTFRDREEVRDYLEECMTAAALSAFRNEPDSEVLRRLLNHVSQRFRLNFILGNGPSSFDEDLDDEDEPDPKLLVELDSNPDIEKTNALLVVAVKRLGVIAREEAAVLSAEPSGEKTDERAVEEIFEENLDRALRENDEFQQLADDLMDEIERRFDVLQPEHVRKTKQGWPYLWSWETDDRELFLKTINRFSANHFRYFGTLLSPLVNGIRVAGPFQPAWNHSRSKLVLFDIEGLGHTPESATSIPTSVTRRLDDVDAVLLVDSAAQPMQAAPDVVMRSIVRSGHASKLVFCFTHMDRIVGDNLGGSTARKRHHVLASAENVLSTIGQQLGPLAERDLRQRIHTGAFFVADIDRKLDPHNRSDQRSISQLQELITALQRTRELPSVSPAYPLYDHLDLAFRVKNAAEKFKEDWEARLGYRAKQGLTKAHWATVKALTHRLAEGWADHWRDLAPVSDLHGNLQTEIYVFVQNPLEWKGGVVPTDDEKQVAFQRFAGAINKRALDLVARRIRTDRLEAWKAAHDRSGRGSTFERAGIIKDDIYEKAAPIPDGMPSPDRNKFLHEVIEIVQQAAQDLGIELS